MVAVMTPEREQLRRVCRWNRDLAAENAALREALQRWEQECRELRNALTSREAQLEACDEMLGAAMDAALEAQRR
jgi:hypothetical protein